MEQRDIKLITKWLVSQGLEGVGEADMLHGFCLRCREAGLDLSRGLAIIDTLHPVYEGRAFRWRNDGVIEDVMVEYGRTDQGEAAETWRRSVFFHILDTGGTEFSRRLDSDDPHDDFPQLKSFRDDGEADYLALVHRFAGEGRFGEMDCVYSHWMTRHPEGFREEDLEALRRLVPVLALAVKCASLARIAGTLVEVYLGRDAGRRVLSGKISRGVAERIHAVLWFSDLRGFTTITDTASPDEVIPLLNDYAEAAIASIDEAGGDVLKLIGDGILAIFPVQDPAEACRAALEAEAALRRRERALNEKRHAERRPVTTVYLGLHVGEVFYGNIGAENRLDFTVVGPAVNEVSRIAAMCRSVDRLVLLSDDFAAAAGADERQRIVSVGRYALRGVGRAQELFTLEPTGAAGEGQGAA